MKRIFYVFALAIITVALFVGCKKEDQLFEGKDNGLTSFSITTDGITYQAAIVGNEIVLSAPVGVDFSKAVVNYELCEHASIVPDPKTITDWNSQHVFRIKSHSKTTREYTYSMLRTDVSKTGNVHLLTQTDVDNFAKLGITVIDGNLTIGSDSEPASDNIVDLESLSSLKDVRYNIIVNRSFAGTTLKGLENVERCGGLYIGSTKTQLKFPAQAGISINMPMLKSAGDIVLNSSSIKGITFTKLESVSSLYVASNSLTALKLPLLKEAVGGLNLDNNSNSVNSVLSEISFPELEKIGGRLSLQWFSGLNTVGFPKLNYVGGDMDVQLNSPTLDELSFPQLANVRGAVIVERAPGLQKLALPKVKELNSFIYNKTSYGNYPLARLDLSSLETVNKEIYLRGIPMETLILPKLTSVGGDVTFWDLKLATKISMPVITKIGNCLQMYGVATLENMDISTLARLPKLELIGCSSLSTVKSTAVIGELILNYASSSACVTPVFEGLHDVEGKLEFTSDSEIKLFEVKNIVNIGTLKFNGGAEGAVFKLYDTEKIGTFELSSSSITKLDAPKLSEVDNLKFSYISKLTTLNIPCLKTVGTFSLSEHSEWNAMSARMTDLNAYSGITSMGKVTITCCGKLVDFSALSKVAKTLDAVKWSVTNCGYNPTYQDMVDGKCVKP